MVQIAIHHIVLHALQQLGLGFGDAQGGKIVRCTTKADPNIYVMAAEKLGKTVQEVLFLDDNLNADKTAKEAGMPVCGVYDPSSEEYTQQIKDATDYYIYDFIELLDLEVK